MKCPCGSVLSGHGAVAGRWAGGRRHSSNLLPEDAQGRADLHIFCTTRKVRSKPSVFKFWRLLGKGFCF